MYNTENVVVSNKLRVIYCTYENDAYRLKSYLGGRSSRSIAWAVTAIVRLLWWRNCFR